ncbi:septation protein SepH [Sediminivirga luteola]|uniref:DUF3071 domain-containing protein n=1 Tax=Sediminivirga luteola TaxID=1774748 RepID=A0A8J2TWL2_9MICO|nr:septation protein SepH [Sediminivirga luteola]GGA08199.1 hypothetical protein GCM10011333_08800 [Sediminivirga luteola]
MSVLTLHEADQDGTHLLLHDGDGTEYRLPLDEDLFALVRRARAGRPGAPGDGESAATGDAVRPKDIQALIRAGLSVEDVIAETGADRSFVARYEGPVLAERAHIAERARRTRVYPENRPEGNPRPLLDLCTERLSMREVDLETMSWDAWRRQDGKWTVELSFEAAGRRRAAEWLFHSGALTPQNEEALWLSDGGPSDTGPIPSYGPAGERVFNIQADEASASGVRAAEDRTAGGDTHAAETGRILEQLRQRRGRPVSERGADPADTPEGAPGQDFRSGRVSRHGILHAVQEDTTGFTDDPDRMPGAHAATPEETGEAEIFALPRPGQEKGRPGAGTLQDQLSLLDEPGMASEDVAADEGNAAPDEAGGGYESAKYDTVPMRDETGQLDALRGTGEEQTPEPARDTVPRRSPAEETEERPRGRRASVPSWDEIMFGGKKD